MNFGKNRDLYHVPYIFHPMIIYKTVPYCVHTILYYRSNTPRDGFYGERKMRKQSVRKTGYASISGARGEAERYPSFKIKSQNQSEPDRRNIQLPRPIYLMFDQVHGYS